MGNDRVCLSPIIKKRCLTCHGSVASLGRRQEKAGRFDLPGFRPNKHYVHWMKRFGALPATFDLNKDPIDVYATDQAYWKSLWPQPARSDNLQLANGK